MGEGLGANFIFYLSNFSLKHTDKPEFEGFVRVQMDGRPMVAPTTMLVRKLFDKPEFIYPFFEVF